ncbi:MAG: ABC transporter substrate-binding protein [Firmicutes bacterium]|nr:ABC transporter substrate-binding protein [Bacillota bacterium]
MSSRKFSVVLVVVMLFSLAFTATAQERTGTWVDEVIFVLEENVATAVSRLQAGDIDVWANSSSDITSFNTVKSDQALDYYNSFGSYNEITYNTVGPEFNDGRLNPLGNRRIREATNMLVDRDYIAQEIFGGLAVPKYTLLNRSFVDYSRVIEKIRELELKYAYNPDAANEIISEEMVNMGAELVDGIWHYNGEPVEILVLARSEDERKQLGDYVAQQFESIGFKTVIDYRTGAEASPIWLMGDPWLGEWNVYTGGWLAPVVYRDQGHIFNQMYTDRSMPAPRFQALDPIPELADIADALYNREFNTMEERKAIYERALELGFQDSPCIFIVDQMSFTPVRSEISVASDLAGYVAGTALWAPTLRRYDEVGGSVTIALPQVLVDPWNAVAGSNWSQDQMPIRATFDRGFISDPFTGNYRPHRIEKLDVTVKEGLPVSKSLDWVTLDFAPEIEVPGDAWAEWDPVEQRFITVDEKWPEGVTALRKSVVHYREDLFDTAKWHDGSPYTIGDMLFTYVLSWDRAYPESPYYDKSEEGGLQTTLKVFKGIKILSEDPFVYELYSDSWSLDAEQNISDIFAVYYDYGKAPWHTLALGMLAEVNGELAFSSSKANELECEWLGFEAGPSIPILAKYLDVAIEDDFLPYADFLSDYISEEEIQTRYANAKAWYESKGHFYIGDGPMYLERAFPLEKMVHLKRFEDYSEPADKWAMFEEPHIAELDVSGPARVAKGADAKFNVEVTFNGEPYALEDISEIKYIVLDGAGNVVLSGQGTGVADGKFEVTISAEELKALPVGSNTLEVVALPKLVGGASFEHHVFVTLP